MKLRSFSVSKSFVLSIGVLVLLGLLFACVSINFATPSAAATSAGFYYDQLDPLSQRFYEAIDDMYKKGNLKTGNFEYDLIDKQIITNEQAKAYSEGDKEIVNAFFAAKDAFFMDKNVFYVDFDKLNLSVSSKDNRFIATIGTGRDDSYYVEGFESVSGVESALTLYNEKFDELVAGISSSLTVSQKIEEINTLLLDLITYGYGFDAEGEATDKTPLIYSNYGALIKNVAQNEGYARLTRDILTDLGIQNVLVKGFILNENEAYQPAMWNVVEIDDKWYGLDIALNALSTDKTQYLLVGQDVMKFRHFTSGIVAQDERSFVSPYLSKQGYFAKSEVAVSAEFATNMTLITNFMGKNALNLVQDGQYLAFSCSTAASTDDNIVWQSWIAAGIASEVEDGEFSEKITHLDTETSIIIDNSVPFVRVAVLNVAPTDASGVYGMVEEENILSISSVIANQKCATYSAAPSPKSIIPMTYSTTSLSADRTYTIVICYDEPLVKIVDAQSIKIGVTSTYGAETGEDLDASWNSSDTVTFSFTPSTKYNDNFETYVFSVKNLEGSKSHKAPKSVSFNFARNNIMVSTLGQNYTQNFMPVLANNSQFDLSGWTYKDVNGITKQANQNLSSQLTLVSSMLSSKYQTSIVRKFLDTETRYTNADIYGINMYNVSLNIAGGPVLSTGTDYVRIQFTKSVLKNNTSYLIYYCTIDNDEVSEITQINSFNLGEKIVAETNKFGIFISVAVNKAKVSTDNRSIYVNNINAGGKVITKMNGKELTNLMVLKLNESVIVEFVADTDYSLNYCLLNGKELQVVDNKVIISYNDLLPQSVLDVAFSSNRVINFENTVGLKNLQKSYVQNQYDTGAINWGLWICIGCVVLVVLGLLIAYLAIKCRDKDKNN